MDRLILPGLALSLVLVSASAFAQVKPEGAPVRLGELRFEKDLKDPRGYLTVERSSVGRRVKPVEETVTYVKGHTGFAARSSHNNEDDHGGDLSIRVGPRTGPWTKRNELYIHFRVKYEKEYRNVPGARTWNVKWLWTLGKVAHNEVAFYNYRVP